jgi:hypothetical protein
MKILLLSFIVLSIGVFLWASNAFAYPGILKPAAMPLVGLCLVLIAVLGRKKILKK